MKLLNLGSYVFYFSSKPSFMFLQLALTKLDVYRFSQQLALECYLITKKFPNEEKFSLVQQIRRAALSVHLNLAEGCSRKSLTERKRFFERSRGSVIEIDTAVGLAFKFSSQRLGNYSRSETQLLKLSKF